ncbi:hypothetical protein OJAV_G00185510 [Oryzias javanicus]|uniref:Uncharacterized protein n=1 Tax=Oryzias javanicus TaxID=123683 RepID=A0A437CDN3_ORYJA|nr:hypothetical protein OJAV_G00185510 [Oryzias javanicus]
MSSWIPSSSGPSSVTVPRMRQDVPEAPEPDPLVTLEPAGLFSTQMAVRSSSSLVFLIVFLSVAVETRPSSDKDEEQVLKSLFGPHLGSLILAPPTSDDTTEGSSVSLDPPAPSEAPVMMRGEAKGTAARILRSFLRQREKTRRWGRKTMVAGGGCFGMKMDRIGSISGLGC